MVWPYLLKRCVISYYSVVDVSVVQNAYFGLEFGLVNFNHPVV
jgi:hypothetical protein